jgi:hypothetical protein
VTLALTLSETIRHNRSKPTTARSMNKTEYDCAEPRTCSRYSNRIGHVSAICCLPRHPTETIISSKKTQAGS